MSELNSCASVTAENSDAQELAFELQNGFHEFLQRYIEGSDFSKRERLLWSFPFRSALCSKNSADIVDAFQHLAQRLRSLATERKSEEIRVPSYKGDHWAVTQLQDYLDKHLRDQLIAGIVHGSLGTDEEVAYSDFDALLVLKDSVFQDAPSLSRVRRHILSAQELLWRYDSLQHHGFFVLSELDLNNYCNAYFPAVLYQHAKSLLSDSACVLTICPRESRCEEMQCLTRMLAAIREKLTSQRYPTNYFELKLLISQILLLPCLFLQSQGESVFKRDSFTSASSSFGDEWSVIEEASEIREAWVHRPSLLVRIVRAASSNPYLTMWSEKRCGSQLSNDFKARLSPNFYSRVLRLVDCIEHQASRQSPRIQMVEVPRQP